MRDYCPHSEAFCWKCGRKQEKAYSQSYGLLFKFGSLFAGNVGGNEKKLART